MTQADHDGAIGGEPAPGREPPATPSARPEDTGTPASEPRAPQGKSGAAGVIGVFFVIGLLVLAAVLINRLKTSSDLMDCAITHAPSCRDLIRN